MKIIRSCGGILAAFFLAPAMGIGSPLVQYTGATAAFTGIWGVGWHQAMAEADVTISVPFFHEPPTVPTPVTAYLMTSIGPGATDADQIATSAVTILPSIPSVTYVLFSGLDLPAGSYYLVVNTGSNDVGWSGGLPATGLVSVAPDVAYLGAYSLNGALGNGYDPADPVGALMAFTSNNIEVPGSLSFEVSAAVVPESGTAGQAALGLCAVACAGLWRRRGGHN